jgi:hypothetical protein
VVQLPSLLPAAQPATPHRDRAPEFQELVQRIALELERSHGDDNRIFRARYRQLGEAISAWNASARSDVDAEIMAGWLRGALRLALARPDRPFPPPPQFTAREAIAEPTEAEQAPVELTPALDIEVRNTSAAASPSADANVELPAATVPPTAAPLAGSDPAGIPEYRTDRRDGLAPIYHGDSETHSPSDSTPPEGHVVLRVDPEPTREMETQSGVDAEPNEPMERASGVATTTQAGDVLGSNAHVAEPSTDVSSSTPMGESLSAAPSPAAEGKPTSPSGISRTAPGATDPFQDDPSPEDNHPPTGQPPAAQASSSPKAHRQEVKREAQLPPRSVHPSVNLAELRARIEGYDRGLRNIESRLMGYEALSAADLIKMARALDDLLNQREFVALYVGTLTLAERRALPELREADPAVDLLAQQIVEKRHALQRRAVLDSDDRRRDWLLLQEASRRLTNLGTESDAN